MARKKKKRKNGFYFDYSLLFVLIFIVGFGLTMVYSTSSYTAQINYGDPEYYFKKQLFFDVGGFVIMLFIARFLDYHVLKRFAPYLFIMALISVVAVIFFGTESHGAKRWIYLTETLSFQPSEIVKFLVIIFYAGMLVKDRDELPFYWKGLVKHILYLAPIIGLLLLEPHLSASMVIIGIVCVMMIVAGCKFKHFALTGLGVGIPGLAALIALEPYRLKRFVTFMDPWQDIKGDGWQVVQSLYAIGSGGLFGVGLGDSKQKYLYIPEPHNDFIFSILAEELGFVGCAVVLILFAVFIWRGVLIAMKAPDMFGSLIAIGITSLVAIQVIINVAVVTSSMPATGMPLPFFSYRRYGIVYLVV